MKELFTRPFTTLRPLSYRRNVTWLWLIYCSFHDKCWNEFHSIIPSAQIIITQTLQVTYTNTFTYIYTGIPIVRWNFLWYSSLNITFKHSSNQEINFCLSSLSSSSSHPSTFSLINAIIIILCYLLFLNMTINYIR